MAFFQVRGSIPVYWSQPGYKYRPPPRIDRGNLYKQQLELYETESFENCVYI